MAIPNTNISLTTLKNEFGGPSVNIKEGYYYRGYYVPDLTTNANVSNSRQNISASSLKGATKQNYYGSQSMYNTGSTLSAGSSYFTGGVPGYSWGTLYSTSYTEITTPNVTYPLKLYVGGGSVQIGGGYRWYDPGCSLFGCGSTSYYYDRMRSPGVAIWNGDSTAVLTSVTSTNSAEVNYRTNSGYTEYRYWSSLQYIVQPNTTYRLYYQCDFWAETGNSSFAWYGLSTPYCYVYNY